MARKTTSTNYKNERLILHSCNIAYALNLIGGRWKAIIIWHLQNKVLRYSELKKIIPAISERMLASQLQELEIDGLVDRTSYAAVPPRVEYKLSQQGSSLIDMLAKLEHWGGQHKSVFCQTKADTLEP